METPQANTAIFKTQIIKGWQVSVHCELPASLVAAMVPPVDRNLSLLEGYQTVLSSEFTHVVQFLAEYAGKKHLVYCKRYRSRSVYDFFKRQFRKSPACRSLAAAQELEKAGVKAPRVLAIMDRRFGPLLMESVLLTEGVENSDSLLCCLRQLSENPCRSNRLTFRRILSELGTCIGQMHAAEIGHGDLRVGNILVQQSGQKREYYLIDNESTQKRNRLFSHIQLKNLVQLNLFREQISNTDRMRFFCRYADKVCPDKASRRQLIKKIISATARRIGERINPAGRMRKYLQTNQFYIRSKTSDTLFVLDRNLASQQEFSQWIQTIDQQMNQGQILKNADRSKISHITWKGHDLVVKRYNPRSLFYGIRQTLRGSRACRSWLHGRRLLNIGVATPRPMAFIECYRGSILQQSYIITQYAEGLNFAQFRTQHKDDCPQVQSVVRQVGQILNTLASYKISHGDMKHTNLLIVKDKVLLTDLDALKVHRLSIVFKWMQHRDIRRFLEGTPPSFKQEIQKGLASE